jgi:hypothetical protein
MRDERPADEAISRSMVCGRRGGVKGHRACRLRAGRGLDADAPPWPSAIVTNGTQVFSRGSSASRSPSPTMLMASTVTEMASPGNVVTHQA